MKVCRAHFKNCARYYQYRDRLGSSVIEANELGQVISYEEYYPYGATAYSASSSSADLSLKRYRFTGKERDSETGLDYFGVRYYASWLGRWTSGDPGGFVDGLNMYQYTRNNPVNGVDVEGYSTETVGDPVNTNPLIKVASGAIIQSSVSEENIPIVTASRPSITEIVGSPDRTSVQDNLPTILSEEDIILPNKSSRKEILDTKPIENGTIEEGYNHGDIRIYTSQEWHGNVEVTRSQTHNYHGGNQYLEEGWYDETTFIYGNLDYENGQVLPPQTQFEYYALNNGIRTWGSMLKEDPLGGLRLKENAYLVDQYGYVTGKEAADMYIDPTLFLGGGKKVVGGVVAAGFKINKVAAGINSAKYFFNRHKQLTNGKYIVSREAMAKHVFGGVPNRSIFYPTLDAEQTVLKAAEYADKFKLWDKNGKAKVRVINSNIGTLSNGQPTNYINVYRNTNNAIHGSPGSILKK